MQAKDGQGRQLVLQRDDLDAQEGYHLALSRAGEKIGHVALEDELRPEAAQIVDRLKKLEYMLAGVGCTGKQMFNGLANGRELTMLFPLNCRRINMT